MSNILVPVSGGKDSTASLLLALESGNNNVVPVFNDTGWEHPLTYKYLDTLEDTLGVKINKTSGSIRKGKRVKTLPELIVEQGRFPFGLGRFCTMYLKQYALRDWYRDNLFDKETNWEFWFGLRQQESSQRAKKYAGIEPEDLFDMNDLFPNRYNKKLRSTIQVRLPVVTWSEDDVFNYADERGVPRNPLYNEGTNDRVGCYPCMLAGKKVQNKMLNTEFGQQRLMEIKKLEETIGKKYEMFDTDQGSCEVCKI